MILLKLLVASFVWSPGPFGTEGERMEGEGSSCSWCHPELPHVPRCPSSSAMKLWFCIVEMKEREERRFYLAYEFMSPEKL